MVATAPILNRPDRGRKGARSMPKQDNPKTMQTLLMTPTEAARLAGVSTRTITRMCVAGELPAVKLRGVWRVNRAEFMRTIGAEVAS